MAEKIAVYLEKGGSTKTTTAVHFAHCMAANGLKVLVVDMDGQCHSSKWLAGNDIPALTLFDVAGNPSTIAEAVQHTRIPNLDLLYGSRRLPNNAESVLSINQENGMRRETTTVLKKALSLVDHQYDVIFIDCSPSLSLLNTNALVAADHILVPLDLADMSFEGLGDVARTLVQMKDNDLIARIPSVTVVVTQTKSSESKTASGVYQQLANAGGAYTVLNESIRYREQVRGVFSKRRTVFELVEGGSFATLHLRAVADDYRAAAEAYARLLATETQQHLDRASA